MISGCIPSKTPADYEALVSLVRSVASSFKPRAVETEKTQRSPMKVSMSIQGAETIDWMPFQNSINSLSKVSGRSERADWYVCCLIQLCVPKPEGGFILCRGSSLEE